MKGNYGNPNQVILFAMKLAVTDYWLDQGKREFGHERGHELFATRILDSIQAQRDHIRRVRASVHARDRWALPHPDFFRIHDAGDFYRPDYYRAWLHICRHMPDVAFWAPNRTYATTTQFELGEGAEHETFDTRDIPDNLALRPSALHFGDAAVEVPGLSAGSGATSEDIENYPEHRKWECPATLAPGKPFYGGADYKYRAVRATGELVKTGGLEGANCARSHGPNSPVHGGSDKNHTPMGHGCRVCWLDKKRYVYYHEH